MNKTKRRLAKPERRPVAVSPGDMSELERYNRMLAILDEAARACNMSLDDVAKWRAHIERKLAKLEQVDNERQEAPAEEAGTSSEH